MIEQLHEVIREIEQTWDAKRLLVVGDVMLDKYIWGEVGRISPEAPVPVVRSIYHSEQPGGAANVAMNLARLGAQTTVVGFTGGDENEKLLAESLRSNGIAPVFVVSDGFPTITKARILGGRRAPKATTIAWFRACWRNCQAAMPWCFQTMPRACSRPRSARRSFRAPAGSGFRCWWTPRTRILAATGAPQPSAPISVNCLWPRAWQRIGTREI